MTPQMGQWQSDRKTNSGDLILRGGCNWMAVAFFAALAAVHLSISIPAFVAGHPEGYLSLVLASGFGSVALACWLSKREVSVLCSAGQIRVRTGMRCLFCSEQCIPFELVRAVRLTIGGGERSQSRIELLCENQDVLCPAADAPRQRALCLAMAMHVRLIKVYEDGPFDDTAPRQQQL